MRFNGPTPERGLRAFVRAVISASNPLGHVSFSQLHARPIQHIGVVPRRTFRQDDRVIDPPLTGG